MERFKKTLQAKVASEEQGPPEQGPLTERVQQLADIYARQATDVDPAILDSERALMDSATGPEDLLADSRAMAQYEAEYARYTAQQQEKVRNGTDVTTRSPAAQEVIRIVSNATLPELQNTAEMPPDDWARQLRAYNSLRGWSTLPALLLLSNRLGERYNRKRRLDEDTPLLADVKNPLLYAWYRMTDGPDNVKDAYRGEAAVLHTLYPFGAVMLTACFVKMSLIEDGGLLTTIANRWATTMAARTYDTVTNVQAQAAAADKVVRFATGYDNTTAFDVAAASANTPQAAVVAASLVTKLFGGPVVAGAASAAVAVWNNPHETHETIENMYTGVALAGDAMETTAWESSLPALMPSGQSVASTALSDMAGMEVTPEYLADVGQTGLGLVATVLEVGLVYTGRRLGLPEVDRSSAWVELVEARATPVELTCLRNAKPAEMYLRGIGLSGPGCDTIQAQTATAVMAHQDGANWSDACDLATKCLMDNEYVLDALKTGSVDVPRWRAVKASLAPKVVTAIDAFVYMFTQAVVLSVVPSETQVVASQVPVFRA